MLLSRGIGLSSRCILMPCACASGRAPRRGRQACRRQQVAADQYEDVIQLCCCCRRRCCLPSCKHLLIPLPIRSASQCSSSSSLRSRLLSNKSANRHPHRRHSPLPLCRSSQADEEAMACASAKWANTHRCNRFRYVCANADVSRRCRRRLARSSATATPPSRLSLLSGTRTASAAARRSPTGSAVAGLAHSQADTGTATQRRAPKRRSSAQQAKHRQRIKPSNSAAPINSKREKERNPLSFA